MPETLRAQTAEQIRAGQFGEALQSARKWVKRQRSPEALYAVAFCHSRRGELRQAISYLDSALRLDKTHGDATVLLALTHLQLRNISKTRETLGRFHQLDGPLTEASLQTAMDLCATFKAFHKAREYGEKLVRLYPVNAGSWVALANIYHYCHQPEEAESACLRALALDPNHADACYALSQYRRATAEHNHLEHFKSAYAKTSAAPGARFSLGAALGKEYEDLGEYETAFEWLDIAMSARSEGLPRQRIVMERQLVEDVASAFETIDRKAVAGFPSERPIFIVGMPRSGTTLLEQILGTCDDIHVAGELDDFDIALWSQIDPDKTARSLSEAYIDQAAKIDFARLGADYLASVTPQIGEQRFFIDKKPHNFLNVGYIALALPEAKIICLQRDARDTCFANFKQAFGDGNHLYSYRQEDVARYYRAYRELMDFWQERFPERILEVHYEDLVSDPAATSKRVFHHIGLEWSSACLSFHESPKASGSASSEQVRRPIYASSIGRWKHFRDHLAPMQQVLDQG